MAYGLKPPSSFEFLRMSSPPGSATARGGVTTKRAASFLMPSTVSLSSLHAVRKMLGARCCSCCGCGMCSALWPDFSLRQKEASQITYVCLGVRQRVQKQCRVGSWPSGVFTRRGHARAHGAIRHCTRIGAGYCRTPCWQGWHCTQNRGTLPGRNRWGNRCP